MTLNRVMSPIELEAMQKVAIAVAQSVFHSSWLAKNVDASSKEKSTPPTGAPKAAANPAAAPIDIRSRLSASFRKCESSNDSVVKILFQD